MSRLAAYCRRLRAPFLLRAVTTGRVRRGGGRPTTTPRLRAGHRPPLIALWPSTAAVNASTKPATCDRHRPADTETPSAAAAARCRRARFPVPRSGRRGHRGSLIGCVIGTYFVTQIRLVAARRVMAARRRGGADLHGGVARTAWRVVRRGLGLGLLPCRHGPRAARRDRLSGVAAGVPAFLHDPSNLLLLNEFPDEKATGPAAASILVLPGPPPCGAGLHGGADSDAAGDRSHSRGRVAPRAGGLSACCLFGSRCRPCKWALSPARRARADPGASRERGVDLTTNSLLAAGLPSPRNLGW